VPKISIEGAEFFEAREPSPSPPEPSPQSVG
jgi:hypothetical protein